MSGNRTPLVLRVVTPTGVAAETECESVILPLADDAQGEGGGSMGVRRGHEQALAALSAGIVRANRGDQGALTLQITAGIASIKHDVVTVVTDSAQTL